MTTVFLIGPRGCGKTRMAEMLAKKLSRPYVDTDKLVVTATGKSIAAIVAQEGWEKFRDHEAAALAATPALLPDGGIVATGGGIVLRPENRDLLRSAGATLYLAAPPAVLAKRLARSRNPEQRPPLTGQDILSEIAAIAAERHPLYLAAAHHVIDASLPPGQVLAAILDLHIFPAEHP
jgi:shikimate kinase